MKLKLLEKLFWVQYIFFKILIQVWGYKLQSVNNYVQLENNYAHTN